MKVKGPSFLGFCKNLGKYPAFHFYNLMEKYGDIVKCTSYLYLVNNPDIVKQMLNRDRQDLSQEDFISKRTRILLGNGLATSKDETWPSERKLMNPVFKPESIHKYISTTLKEIDKVLDNWKVYSEKKMAFDLVDEMGTITIMTTGKILFDKDFHNDVNKLKKIFISGTNYISNGLPFYTPFWIPTPANLNQRMMNQRADSLLEDIVRERLKLKSQRNDLLGTLISALAQPDSTDADRRLMLDEMKTMLAGGYFPVACSLSIFWYLMGKYPAHLEKLNKEITGIASVYKFTERFYKDFPETTKIILECMRFYPVAFSIWRKTKFELKLNGLAIPKGVAVVLSIFNVHRHPKFWENPDAFDPERFNEERSKNRPKHAFIPFGWGNRKCIGDHFAMLVNYLTIIRIIQKFEIDILPGQKLNLKSSPLMSPKKLLATVRLRTED